MVNENARLSVKVRLPRSGLKEIIDFDLFVERPIQLNRRIPNIAFFGEFGDEN